MKGLISRLFMKRNKSQVLQDDINNIIIPCLNNLIILSEKMNDSIKSCEGGIALIMSDINRFKIQFESRFKEQDHLISLFAKLENELNEMRKKIITK